jgi:prepilin peptidase CpaA
MLTSAIVLLVFPALMAFAAASDLLTMTISNRLALVLVGAFFVLALATGMEWQVIGIQVAAALGVLVFGFACFARGWIGGGDAKLAAATVLWLGVDHMLPYLLWASIIGGVLTFLIIKFRTLPLPAFLSGQAWLVRLHRMDAGVPYGIALAAAALLIYPETSFMRAIGL